MTEDPLAFLDTDLRKLMELRETYDHAKAAKTVAHEALKAHERVVHDKLASSTNSKSQTTITRDLGAPWGEVRFQRRVTLYGRVYDHEAALEAVRAEGGDLEMALVLPASHVKFREKAVNDLVKEREENGQPLPEGIEPAPRKFVQVTKV